MLFAFTGTCMLKDRESGNDGKADILFLFRYAIEA